MKQCGHSLIEVCYINNVDIPNWTEWKCNQPQNWVAIVLFRRAPRVAEKSKIDSSRRKDEQPKEYYLLGICSIKSA